MQTERLHRLTKSSLHRALNFLNKLCTSGLSGTFHFIDQNYQKFTVKQQFLQTH